MDECASILPQASSDQGFAVTCDAAAAAGPADSGPKDESLIMVECDLYLESRDALGGSIKDALPDISPYACFYGAPKHQVLKVGWLDKLSPQGYVLLFLPVPRAALHCVGSAFKDLQHFLFRFSGFVCKPPPLTRCASNGQETQTAASAFYHFSPACFILYFPPLPFASSILADHLKLINVIRYRIPEQITPMPHGSERYPCSIEMYNVCFHLVWLPWQNYIF